MIFTKWFIFFNYLKTKLDSKDEKTFGCMYGKIHEYSFIIALVLGIIVNLFLITGYILLLDLAFAVILFENIKSPEVFKQMTKIVILELGILIGTILVGGL
jgi:hypothetical protein